MSATVNVIRLISHQSSMINGTDRGQFTTAELLYDGIFEIWLIHASVFSAETARIITIGLQIIETAGLSAGSL